MPVFNLGKNRQWGPRTETGWERCGLYNDIVDRATGSRQKPACRSYTTLNRVAPGGGTSGTSFPWEWELYVIEGQLSVDGLNLGPGDHAVVGANEVFSCASAHGCTLLTVAHEFATR